MVSSLGNTPPPQRSIKHQLKKTEEAKARHNAGQGAHNISENDGHNNPGNLSSKAGPV
jgi:hypothetical protein